MPRMWNVLQVLEAGSSHQASRPRPIISPWAHAAHGVGEAEIPRRLGLALSAGGTVDLRGPKGK